MRQLYEYLIGGRKIGKKPDPITFAELRKGDYYYVWRGKTNGDTILECEFYETGSEKNLLIDKNGRVDCIHSFDLNKTVSYNKDKYNPWIISTSFEELMKVFEVKFNITGGLKLHCADGKII